MGEGFDEMIASVPAKRVASPRQRSATSPAFGVPSCRSAAIRRSERAIVRCS
jgi:hypothetical protein